MMRRMGIILRKRRWRDCRFFSGAGVGIAQVLAGGIGARGVGAGVNGGLVVLDGQLALAVQVVALAGGEQRTNLELGADVGS